MARVESSQLDPLRSLAAGAAGGSPCPIAVILRYEARRSLVRAMRQPMHPSVDPRTRRTLPERDFFIVHYSRREDNAAACLLYDRLTPLLSAATYERIRTASASPSEELPRHRHSARQRIDAAVLALIELLPSRAWRYRGRRRSATVLSGIELLTIGASGLVALVALRIALVALVTLVTLVGARAVVLGLRIVLRIVVLGRRGTGKADRGRKKQAECHECSSHQTLLLNTAIFGRTARQRVVIDLKPHVFCRRSSALSRGNATFLALEFDHTRVNGRSREGFRMPAWRDRPG